MHSSNHHCGSKSKYNLSASGQTSRVITNNWRPQKACLGGQKSKVILGAALSAAMASFGLPSAKAAATPLYWDAATTGAWVVAWHECLEHH